MKAVALLASGLVSAAVAASGPPAVFVDRGACPFECCTYRQWSVERDTRLFDALGGRRIVGVAQKGTAVRALTGEVHTVPLAATLSSGREVYMLTYRGEGFWRTWDHGRVRETNDDALQRHAAPKSTWWLKIRLPNGTTGWTDAPRNFGNQDACG